MSYQIKITRDKITKLSHAFKARLAPKYELYAMAVSALNGANEEYIERAMGLVLSLEKELFDAISEAVDARFPVKTISDFEKNKCGFDTDGRKKRDLKKSLFLDLVISQMLRFILAQREEQEKDMKLARP